MRRAARRDRWLGALLVLLAWTNLARGDGGAALYARFCAACHGEAGDGQGPAAPWLWPAPRDLAREPFKWRSTASGGAPTDDDVARSIRDGAPGTAMPAFRGILHEPQIMELVATVRSMRKKPLRPAPPMPVPEPPAASTVDGKQVFARACAACHGETGRGDGPSAAALVDGRGRPARPFDLTTQPLRRGADARAIVETLVTGLDGTPMPSFRAALGDAELWAVASLVDGWRLRGPAPPLLLPPRSEIRTGLHLDPQGPPPASLTPAQASLSSEQCGRCHAKQLREWRGTLHARAEGPGVAGQYHGRADAFVTGCQRCHGPLAEQRPGPSFDPSLRAEGVTCAACHVRGHVRHGPPLRQDGARLSLPGYPLVIDPAYERSDFCLPCHQLPPSDALAGKPLLDTYREWLVGPYMRRGVQCQHCHMPDREHTWKGVHDPETVRQAVRLGATARRTPAGIEARVTLENVGAGHNFPTTPTPAAFLEVTLRGPRGDLATRTARIGRHIEYRASGWVEHQDSRIAPGATREFVPRFPDAAAATSVRVRLRMAPDDYYEGFYESLLRGKLAAPARKQLETALARARASHFVVRELEIPIPSPRR